MATYTDKWTKDGMVIKTFSNTFGMMGYTDITAISDFDKITKHVERGPLSRSEVEKIVANLEG